MWFCLRTLVVVCPSSSNSADAVSRLSSLVAAAGTELLLARRPGPMEGRPLEIEKRRRKIWKEEIQGHKRRAETEEEKTSDMEKTSRRKGVQ